MPSKMVTDRQKSSQSVLAAARTHADTIVRSMGDTYGSRYAEPTQMLIQGLSEMLAQRTQALVEADAAHLNELGDDATARDQRDAAAESLRALLVERRQLLAGVFGTGYLKELGFEGRTPEDAVALARFARRVAENLERVPTPPSLIPGVTLAPAAWRQPVVSVVEALEAAIGSVRTEEREAEATVVTKKEAMAAYDRTFTDTATLLSALLNAAGERALADRVKPSTRRPGQTTQDANDGSVSMEAVGM